MRKSMASKFANVVKDLLPAPPEDPGYQGKVDTEVQRIMFEHKTLTPEQMAAHYAVVRAKRDLLKEQMYQLQITITAYEQMLVASWDSDEEGWGLYGAKPNSVK